MRLLILPLLMILAACEDWHRPEPVTAVPATPATAPAPPAGATTVADFDTTTSADRAAALSARPDGTVAALGTTVATLGSPAEPGIWLKTPLVGTVTQGRITYGGKTINIELRPSGGAPGAGSEISLPAMRLIGAPLTALAELTVFGSRG